MSIVGLNPRNAESAPPRPGSKVTRGEERKRERESSRERREREREREKCSEMIRDVRSREERSWDREHG